MKLDRIHRARAGLTLIELVLAVGLLAVLMLAVFQLFDRSLLVWRNGETRRAVLEQSSVVIDSLGRDLRGIECGPRGDLVAEWVRFDTDGDGIKETKWPRLRLIRQASSAEVAQIERADREARETRSKPASSDEPIKLARSSPSLVEVVWMVAPASVRDKDARSEGLVWRGEHLVGDISEKSFFAPDFFGTSNLPPAGATEEVTGGLLWMNVLFAAQTSVVHDGWKLTKDLSGAATSWDAWVKGRPDVQQHEWNDKPAGMPKARARPILPRRVRIELEFERPADRTRRTRLLEAIDNNENVLRVDDEKRVPAEPDSYVLVDAEWMKVTSVDSGRVAVQRAQRGTTAVQHLKDALVHHGMRIVTETTVATYREDWDL
jgi:hypothetical protein